MKQIDKIIFLDVDGVLNHNAWYKWIMSHPEFLKEGGHRSIDPRSVERVIKICDKTGARIVMSSSWRLWEFYQTLKNLNSIRDLRPILDYMVGITERTDDRFRGQEIKYFLNNCRKGNFITVSGNNLKKADIEFVQFPKYIILDDDTDMLDEQANVFLHIDDMVGITHKDVEKAIKILNEGD